MNDDSRQSSIFGRLRVGNHLLEVCSCMPRIPELSYSVWQGNDFHVHEVIKSQADFPLPTLGPKLEAIRENVRIGRGFQLIKYGR